MWKENNNEQPENWESLKSLEQKLSRETYLPSVMELERIQKNIFAKYEMQQAVQKWQEFCWQYGQSFELITQELVTNLSQIIQSFDFGGVEKRVVKILELGAGNGRLTHFLKRALPDDEMKKERGEGKREELARKNFQLKAVDNGEMQIFSRIKGSEVSFAAAWQAVQDYQPDIILVSQMPMVYQWRNQGQASCWSSDEIGETLVNGEHQAQYELVLGDPKNSGFKELWSASRLNGQKNEWSVQTVTVGRQFSAFDTPEKRQTSEARLLTRI